LLHQSHRGQLILRRGPERPAAAQLVREVLDGVVEATLAHLGFVIAVRLLLGSQQPQRGVLEDHAASGPRDLHAIGRAHAMAGGRHHAVDRHGKSVRGAQDDRRAVLADDVAGRLAGRAGDDLELAEQRSGDVELVDQRLGDEHAFLAGQERLPLERCDRSIRSRQHARPPRRDPRLHDRAEPVLAQPVGDPLVIGTEARFSLTMTRTASPTSRSSD
jgi:hypothetical protein